jgi:hypothetical protein
MVARLVHGIEYHENWRTVEFNKVLDRWYWREVTIGNYTVTIGNYTVNGGLLVASSQYGYQKMPAFYLTKENHVLAEYTKHFIITTSGSRTTSDVLCCIIQKTVIVLPHLEYVKSISQNSIEL